MVFALLGIAASAGYLVLRPTLYTATSVLLIPGLTTANNTQTTPSNDMSTVIQVVTGASVLSPAGRQVDPSLSLATLRQRVKAVGVATNVLSITAAGETGAQAESLANAVTKQLVAFNTDAGLGAEQSALTALHTDADQLTSQISSLNGEITVATNRLAAESTASAAGNQDSALIITLTTELNQAELQLDGVNSQIAQAGLSGLAAGQGTEVIQRATTASAPSILHKAYTVMIGAIVGLLLSAALILVRHRRDRRLHLRDEVAETVGVPVLISMSAPSRRRSISDWVELFNRYTPSAADHWGVRQALRDLDLGGTPAHLSVLVIAGDTAALAAAAQVAITLSTFGLETVFITRGEHDFATCLRSVCNRFSGQGHNPRPNLQVRNEALPDDAETPALVLTCIVVDSERPELSLTHLVGSTLLATSAGFGTADQLARVAIAASDVGAPLAGVVLTNPDIDDRTSGRFPQVRPNAAPTLLVPNVTSRGLVP